VVTVYCICLLAGTGVQGLGPDVTGTHPGDSL